MKQLFFIVGLFVCFNAAAQQKAANIIIVTTDGLRWQEVFKGMDTALANNPEFNQGSLLNLYKNYGDREEKESRRKLLPFLWTVVAKEGQLYGNRQLGNKVNNTNPYWFSYPGYSEMMTGYVDSAINTNSYPPNPNETVLEFFNKQPAFKGRVAAFAAWEAFNRILNEDRSAVPVVAAFDDCGGKQPSTREQLINTMRSGSFKPFGDEECLDMFTHFAAMEWLTKKKPKVLYISYGETDEWAHAGKYQYYLDAARQFDDWLKNIWEFVQADPQYKNNTVLFITTDHGRGDADKKQWTSHGSDVAGSGETWMAAIGPGIAAKGEINTNMQIYQQQFAQTIAGLLGYTFKANHPVAGGLNEQLKK